MKKIAIILAMMLPAAAFGQSFSTGARASVGVDYKIKKGLHIEAREEMRANFAARGGRPDGQRGERGGRPDGPRGGREGRRHGQRRGGNAPEK